MVFICHRATSSSPYSGPRGLLHSSGLNSTASSPNSKSSSFSAAPFDLWLEKEFHRRQQKKEMEAMRTYTAAAHITASSPIVSTSPVSATNTIATNPLLSHALNTAGLSKNNNPNSNNHPTTSMELENLINRKRSAEDEIIQIDDDQPTPRRHCSNNVNESPSAFHKPLTTTTITSMNVTIPSTVSTPSTLPPPTSFSTPKPTETTPNVVEGHRYVTLPTIPPISILIPNDTKIMDTLDELINSNPANFNPTTMQQLNGQTNSALNVNSIASIPVTTNSTPPITTSTPSQLLLGGLRQQKPIDSSQSFSSAFLSSHAMKQSQLNPLSNNPLIHPMIQQNINLNNNNINCNNNNNNLNNNDMINLVSQQPQWIHLMQQPQYSPPQKNNLLQQQQQQQIQTPQNFQPTFPPPLQKSRQFQNQPFPPTITNQPQLRFPTQSIPPTSNAGLSALLSQNTNISKSINAIQQQQQNSSTPSLSTINNSSIGMQLLNQPQQNNIENATNLSCNNLINFANFTLPILTPPQPPFILQSHFQPEKQQIQNEISEIQMQQKMTAEEANIVQQNITSMNLLKEIQKHQRLSAAVSTSNQQIQLPSVSQSHFQIPLSQSNSSATNAITKFSFPIEHQPFAQYLLSLPSISPTESIKNPTPQLPSLEQSPSDSSTENETIQTKTFTPKISEQIYTSEMLSQFDISNLKHPQTDDIASSFIEGDISMDDCSKTNSIDDMTYGSGVNLTYLGSLQSSMVVLSGNGKDEQMVN
uniref:Uncharacterized protein n=2 Tax=Panagrolaimus sp. PS1159 TaxID=55785 RepID=A0AC35FJR5_9BILA